MISISKNQRTSLLNSEIVIWLNMTWFQNQPQYSQNSDFNELTKKCGYYLNIRKNFHDFRKEKG
eukprot:snap_masked-scaffold_112-processed-gene-0.9-mRNA-1 protein AED:1.00 eAED:1.00 QI:0/0/0/0/1/1/2/0/63